MTIEELTRARESAEAGAAHWTKVRDESERKGWDTRRENASGWVNYWTGYADALKAVGG